MHLHHEIQDHIDDGAIYLDGKNQNENKSVAKENSELQIYTNPFPSHSLNLIIDPFDASPKASTYANVVSFTPSHVPHLQLAFQM